MPRTGPLQAAGQLPLLASGSLHRACPSLQCPAVGAGASGGGGGGSGGGGVCLGGGHGHAKPASTNLVQDTLRRANRTTCCEAYIQLCTRPSRWLDLATPKQ